MFRIFGTNLIVCNNNISVFNKFVELAPNVVLKEDTISDKSITIKYEKLKVRANQILFTLSRKEGNDFLQEEQVKGEETLEDGKVTFTKGVKADTEYVVKATVVNYVGKNDGIELTITTPKEDGKQKTKNL